MQSGYCENLEIKRMSMKEVFLSAQSFEIALARLYTDPKFRSQFIADPKSVLVNCDLTFEEKNDLLAIDKAGLLMASHSFFHKRKKRVTRRANISFISRMVSLVRKTTLLFTRKM